MYVRTDSDRTTVVSPRLRLGGQVSEKTRVDAVYTVDVWTSASIDILTSASRHVASSGVRASPGQASDLSEVTYVTEQRDEIDLSVSHMLGDARISALYRYSTEPDYESHGGSLSVAYDFAQKSATLAAGATASFDTVGRAGDPGFSRPMRTVSGRVSFTQVLDTQTLAQATYEIIHAQGYLSSPYRFVGIGTPDATCRGTPMYCIPEANPSERVRHAAAAQARRALGDMFSVGAGYRFYFDDWALNSHTVTGELAVLPVEDTILSLRYRFYTQTRAAHYESSYAALDQAGGLYTRDKELATFSAHRVMLDFDRRWALGELGHILRTTISAGPTLYRYTDFLPRPEITALEATLALGLEY